MFDIDKAIHLARERKELNARRRDLTDRINSEADKLQGLINVDEAGRIHIRASSFAELFQGEYDSKRQVDCQPPYWLFTAEADGETFFCLSDKEELNAFN